nr:hypothetical protein [Xenorhabdus miraniensis]
MDGTLTVKILDGCLVLIPDRRHPNYQATVPAPARSAQ